MFEKMNGVWYTEKRFLMDMKEIIGKVDHTLLSPTATENEIITACTDAIEYHAASVCIPPCYVRLAKSLCGEEQKITTVAGFPNGYNSEASKMTEIDRALRDGADEIDFVMNVALFKSGKKELVLNELKRARQETEGKILKVIIECCNLTEEEKIRATEIVALSGADYIKTSTGFMKGGATLYDIGIIKRAKPESLKIKAAGGIRDFDTARAMLLAGVDRLGASALIKLIKEKEKINGLNSSFQRR